MVGFDTYGHFLSQNQRSFLRNSYTWLRAKPREGVLGAFLLYGDRSRKNCQERESRGLPSCNFGAKPSDFLDFTQPGQILPKNTRSSPCQAGKVQQLCPIVPHRSGLARCCRTLGSSARGENTRGLGGGSPQPAHLSQTVLLVRCHRPATGPIRVPVNSPPNKQDTQFVPFTLFYGSRGI